jgi:two-component system sensor histidine kinase KdpD
VRISPIDWGWISRGVAVTIGALAACTITAHVLETGLDLPDASAVYLLGVAAVAIAYGAAAAVATALGSFLIYNFLFVEPRYTFTVASPPELLNLILLLAIGVLIARLAGQQRDRARQAARREREARALFAVSRSLNAAESLGAALTDVVQRVASDAGLERVWIGASTGGANERTLADTAPKEALPETRSHWVMRRDPNEGEAAWLRVLPPAARSASPDDVVLYRVEMRAGGDAYGSLWGARHRASGNPQVEESRLMATAADQVAQALRRQRLADAAAELEIARRSDELKSALLDSVSHDLRTPLATMRAAAGTLADPGVEVGVPERVRLGQAIDTEADRLNRLVGNLLDMSRVDSGALKPELEVLPLSEVLDPIFERLEAGPEGRRVTADVPVDLPALWADPVMLDQVLTNLVENAAKYVDRERPIRVGAREVGGRSMLRIVVEDGGVGVPDEALGRIFDKFYRGTSPTAGGAGRRRGTGLGLAVVRGLVEAMGGSVMARRSELGGLAIVVELPTAGDASAQGAAAT